MQHIDLHLSLPGSRPSELAFRTECAVLGNPRRCELDREGNFFTKAEIFQATPELIIRNIECLLSKVDIV